MILLPWGRRLLGMPSRLSTPTQNSAGPLPTRFSPPPRRSPVWKSRVEVAIHDQANEVVVRLKGEGGYLEGGVLDNALTPLRAHRPALVTFDLSELRLISSMVLGVLVHFHRSTLRTGGRMRLIALQPIVREAIERASLTELFEIHDSADAAVAAPTTAPGQP
jgi:anti-anti-sigma factor